MIELNHDNVLYTKTRVSASEKDLFRCALTVFSLVRTCGVCTGEFGCGWQLWQLHHHQRMLTSKATIRGCCEMAGDVIGATRAHACSSVAWQI
jgi:hypothetical protein